MYRPSSVNDVSPRATVPSFDNVFGSISTSGAPVRLLVLKITACGWSPVLRAKTYQGPSRLGAPKRS